MARSVCHSLIQVNHVLLANFLSSQIWLLTLFAKIKSSRNFPILLYCMYVMRQFTYLAINQIMVYSCGFSLNCTAGVRHQIQWRHRWLSGWCELIFFCGSFVLYMSCVCHAFASVHCCLGVTWRESADLLPLVCDIYCDCVTFPFGILGQVWYLIVSIPDPCCFSYFESLFRCFITVC